MEYLSGYVAFKLRSKHPDHQMISKPSFLENLTYHGLTKPAPIWLQSARKIHKLFEKFHPEKGFKEGKYINKRLFNKIMKKHPEYCESAVKMYIRLRVLARIRKLNFLATPKKCKENKGAEKIDKIRSSFG